MSNKEQKYKYLWEINTQLVLEVQAKDYQAAESTMSLIINSISTKEQSKNFEEIKLRVLQVLTNIDRAAYYAGANPNHLFSLNMNIVHKIITVSTKKEIIALAQETLKNCISLVPEKDFGDARKMKKALAFIRENCGADISRNEVAGAVGCSPSHLSRLFTKITGSTFKDVLLKCKIEKAKEILQETVIPVTEIAYEVGYNDPNYFTSSFKRITGITPSQYRKKVADKII